MFASSAYSGPGSELHGTLLSTVLAASSGVGGAQAEVRSAAVTLSPTCCGDRPPAPRSSNGLRLREASQAIGLNMAEVFSACVGSGHDLGLGWSRKYVLTPPRT